MSVPYRIGLPFAPPIGSTAGWTSPLVDGLLRRKLPTTHGLILMEIPS